jgi:hypothetical protein
MSNHVIRVKSCRSFDIWAFSELTFSKVGRGVKYVFLGFRRQLRCLTEGKNKVTYLADLAQFVNCYHVLKAFLFLTQFDL